MIVVERNSLLSDGSPGKIEIKNTSTSIGLSLQMHGSRSEPKRPEVSSIGPRFQHVEGTSSGELTPFASCSWPPLSPWIMTNCRQSASVHAGRKSIDKLSSDIDCPSCFLFHFLCIGKQMLSLFSLASTVRQNLVIPHLLQRTARERTSVHAVGLGEMSLVLACEVGLQVRPRKVSGPVTAMQLGQSTKHAIDLSFETLINLTRTTVRSSWVVNVRLTCQLGKLSRFWKLRSCSRARFKRSKPGFLQLKGLFITPVGGYEDSTPKPLRNAFKLRFARTQQRKLASLFPPQVLPFQQSASL